MDLLNIDQKNNADSRKPNDVDCHIGRQIKYIRDKENISQKKLADLVGITFQQLQKYENGFNRVVASRLYDFSRVLHIPVSAFFEGINAETEEQSLRMGTFNPQEDYSFAEETMMIDYSTPAARKEEGKALLEAYFKIKDGKKAKKAFDYVAKLAAEEQEHAKGKKDE